MKESKKNAEWNYTILIIVLILLSGLINIVNIGDVALIIKYVVFYFFGFFIFFGCLLCSLLYSVVGIPIVGFFLILTAGIGFHMALINLVISILNSPLSSDGNFIKIALTIALVNCILGYVFAIIYNLSPKFRKYKNSLPIVFVFF